MVISRTLKKAQQAALSEWLANHEISSVDDFLDQYVLIKAMNPELIEELEQKLNALRTPVG